MERFRGLGRIALKFLGVEYGHIKSREEAAEHMADFIEKANPQESIKVVCDPEEIPEVLAGIGEGFRRIEEKKGKK